MGDMDWKDNFERKMGVMEKVFIEITLFLAIERSSVQPEPFSQLKFPEMQFLTERDA